MVWRYEKVNNRLKLGETSVGVQNLVNDLLTRVKDIFQKLRSRLFPQPSTPEPLPPSVEEKPKASSSSRSRKVFRKKPVRIVKKAVKW
jgi:hypothetical protein